MWYFIFRNFSRRQPRRPAPAAAGTSPLASAPASTSAAEPQPARRSNPRPEASPSRRPPSPESSAAILCAGPTHRRDPGRGLLAHSCRRRREISATSQRPVAPIHDQTTPARTVLPSGSDHRYHLLYVSVNTAPDGTGGVMGVAAADKKKLGNTPDRIASEYEADVWLVNSPIYPDTYGQLVTSGAALARRKTAYVVLVTLGGNPHFAYRMGRYFQRNYDSVIVCVPGPCMSGGTLLALAAHELVMSDDGVLGPLDIQLRKADELDEFTSGLTVTNALDTLRAEVRSMFNRSVLTLKEQFGNQITLRTAMDTAAKLTLGIITPIVGQIDPMKLGEDTRSTKIISWYGERLVKKSGNLKPGQLEYLVTGYPSHGFEIDREEAVGLFVKVRKPAATEATLLKKLSNLATTATPDIVVDMLSTPKPNESDDEERRPDDGRTTGRADTGRQPKKTRQANRSPQRGEEAAGSA